MIKLKYLIVVLVFLASCSKTANLNETQSVQYKLNDEFIQNELKQISEAEFDSIRILEGVIFDGNNYDSIYYYKGIVINYLAVLKVSYNDSENYTWVAHTDTSVITKTLDGMKLKVTKLNNSHFEYEYSINGSQLVIMTGEYSKGNIIKYPHLIGKVYINNKDTQQIMEIYQINEIEDKDTGNILSLSRRLVILNK